MTITDLVRKDKELKNAIDNLFKLGQAVNGNYDLDNTLREKANLTDNCWSAINSAQVWLTEYRSLLASIMDQTEIEWPPKIGPSK